MTIPPPAAVEYAGLRVLEQNTIMFGRVFEGLSNEEGEFNLVSRINKFSFAGADWKQVLAAQQNAQLSTQPLKSKKKKTSAHHTDL